jgi:tRNA threonylcarbamoyladenosine biosynthesis protein TsaE
MKFVLDHLADIPRVAPSFLDALKGNKIVAFEGEMGAGKTTFIQGLLAYMQIEDHVSSPTFSIVNEYFSAPYGKVYHFDFYRIEDEIEALDIGVDEIFDEDAYSFMEWPSKIANLLPDNTVFVTIESVNDIRTITVRL